MYSTFCLCIFDFLGIYVAMQISQFPDLCSFWGLIGFELRAEPNSPQAFLLSRFLDIYPEAELLDHLVNTYLVLFFFFLKNCYLVFL